MRSISFPLAATWPAAIHERLLTDVVGAARFPQRRRREHHRRRRRRSRDDGRVRRRRGGRQRRGAVLKDEGDVLDRGRDVGGAHDVLRVQLLLLVDLGQGAVVRHHPAHNGWVVTPEEVGEPKALRELEALDAQRPCGRCLVRTQGNEAGRRGHRYCGRGDGGGGDDCARA